VKSDLHWSSFLYNVQSTLLIHPAFNVPSVLALTVQVFKPFSHDKWVVNVSLKLSQLISEQTLVYEFQ